MNLRTLALVLGAALTVAAAGVSATACSSSSSAGAGGKDSGASVDGTASSSGGSSGGGHEGGGGDGASGGPEAGIDCGAAPALHASDAGSLLCALADAGELDCPTGEQCCLGGSIAGGQLAATGCATFGTACSNGSGDGGNGTQAPIPIECAQISDCVANGLVGATACCLRGATQNLAACAFPVYTGGTAVLCEGDAGGKEAGACAPGEAQLCTTPADCPPGRNCIIGKWKALQPGFCL